MGKPRTLIEAEEAAQRQADFELEEARIDAMEGEGATDADIDAFFEEYGYGF
jgi:hypothetical protein